MNEIILNNNDDNIEYNEKIFYRNKIMRIFPPLKNVCNYSKLKIDNDSFSYITIREIADIISKIICYHLLKYNLNPQKINIVDYTSGVGGNVLSFSKHFGFVHAIELCNLRCEYLINNIDVYGYKNIKVINDSALNYLDNLIIDNINVVFMDPPWGGIGYNFVDKLHLELGGVPIEELIYDIFKKFSENLNIEKNNKNGNDKLIVLKLPKNYDIEFFYEFVKKNNKLDNYVIRTYVYILNKMLIVVCEMCCISS